MKIKQVAIHTNKIDAEIDFYTKECGLKILRDARPNKNIIFLGDSIDETMIEIIGNENVGISGNEYIQITFIAGDVESKRAEMLSKGYECTEIVSPSPTNRFFFTHDPAGVKIQFNS